MALNFPDSPTLNQIYTDGTSGFSYQWNGSVWISYSSSTTSNITELDDISGSFNGSATVFPLTVNSQSVSPASTNQLLISVGGVMQNPTNDFYISGSNIVFTTAPASGLLFFGTLLGTAVPIGVSTIGDVYNRQVYAVTGVQTNFTFTTGYTVGYLDVFRNGSRLISGDDFTATNGTTFSLTPAAQNGDDIEAIGYKVSTIAVTEGNITNLLVSQNAQVLGITTLGANVAAGQTALTVQGNARVTGILTVGSSSITLNGSTDQINVGSGLTLSSSGIVAGVVTSSSFVGSLTGTATGLSGTPNLNVGVVTASSFVGNVTGNATGLSGTPNLNVGVVTATSFVGSGSGLTGVGPSQQAVTSQAGITTINLSSGNVIYFTHNTNTTVAFANTTTTQEVTFIRTKDTTSTTRTITWPSSVRWNGILGGAGSPTLNQQGRANNTQTFKLVTRDSGVTWYGWQESDFPGDNRFLFAWGYNGSSRLGLNDATNYSSPVQIPGTTWNSITSYSYHTLATKTDGTLWAWGNNQFGELAQNNIIQYSSPRQIPGNTWNSIGNSNEHSLATKTDGTLWAWGDNRRGQLGQNNRTYYSSPVQIPGTTWSSVSAIGYFGSLAIKTDGTLWSWGENEYGQLGQNTAGTTRYSSPTQIPGNTWSSVSGGRLCTLATKTDGTLWSWGYNFRGQLGQNNIIRCSSPIQIPGTTWSSVRVYNSTIATKTDGTLWSWGYNTYGQLGQNNVTYYSSPVQIPGTTWSSVSIGYHHSIASKTDGTLWQWGRNEYGQLGQNNRTYSSSPTQIPGVVWGSVTAGKQHSFALG
jgi:hypothetical protein